MPLGMTHKIETAFKPRGKCGSGIRKPFTHLVPNNVVKSTISLENES